ncbi:MAG: MarR family transcriptional regulator [Proteobacteria bacterium]|nr:MarR family transcriptional regulator [Pseudomonadota bacterium]
MSDYETCIIFLLAKAYQKAHGHFKKRLIAHGLTPVQYLTLECLWQEEGIAAGEIGRRLVLDSATLSGVLDRLAEAGWVIKSHDPEDKRVTRVHLTERAREIRDMLIREREEANEHILSGLSLEEKLLFKRFLRDVQG